MIRVGLRVERKQARLGLLGQSNWFLLLGLLVAVSSAVGLAQKSEADSAHARTISATLANPDFKQVLAAGHRGALRQAPENTIPSFEKAIELGADIIEIDVRITRDGHFVIFHDDNVSRLTGEAGTIEEQTLAEVQQLAIQLAEFPGFPSLSILTLEEAVRYLQGRAIIYLDHKTGPVAQLVEEVVRLEATDHAYIVVRTPQAAREARAVSPDIYLMAAITAEEPVTLIDLFLPTRPALFELPSAYAYLVPENVQKLRGMGIRIFTSAMDTEAEQPYMTYQHLLYRGADVIITDHLEHLVPYLCAFNAARRAGHRPKPELAVPGCTN